MNRGRRWLAALLVAMLVFPAAAAMAAEPAVVTGTYEFTSNESHNTQLKDSFTWRDDCFMRSSFLGCSHLMELSATAAIASASRYGDEISEWEIDPSGNAKNITNLLKNAGFEDVETNKYYTLEKKENSAAAALAHRTITEGDKTYTLLAILPRSAGYKQEWVGNFNVNDGSTEKMHAGFKAGRDEILRFTKQYMQRHGITGDLKVWIAGHSRGAALSNMLGGFFAGGGISYFDNVSLTPENLYCYTFATPRTITPGLTHAADLSVAGARGTAYPDDTPGAAYTWLGGGSVTPDAECYKGIRNYPLDHDFIAKLPPEDWGYTWYGNMYSSDGNGTVTTADMLKQLQALSAFAYGKFTEGGGPADYRQYDLDLANMELKEVPSGSGGPGSMAAMVAARVTGLASLATDPEAYADGNYQAALQALAGCYGMLWDLGHIMDDFIGNDGELKIGSLVLPVVLIVMDYAMERMRAENPDLLNETDTEVAARALEALLGALSGEETKHEEFSNGTFLELLSKAIAPDNQDTKLLDTAAGALADALDSLGDMAATVLGEIFSQYMDSEHQDAPMKDKVAAFVKALGYGAREGTGAYAARGCDPKAEQAYVYTMILLIKMFIDTGMFDPGPEAAAVISAIVNAGSIDAAGSFTGLVGALLPLLMPEGITTIPEAADEKGRQLVEDLFRKSLELEDGKYGDVFDKEVRQHVQDLQTYIRPLRQALMYMLLYTDGERFSFASAIRTAATLFGNVSIVPPAHYNEVNLAWARALRAAGYKDHALPTPTPTVTPTPTPSPTPTPEPTPTPKPVPKTGDSAQPVFWLVLVLAGLCGMAVLKRKNS